MVRMVLVLSYRMVPVPSCRMVHRMELVLSCRMVRRMELVPSYRMEPVLSYRMAQARMVQGKELGKVCKDNTSYLLDFPDNMVVVMAEVELALAVVELGKVCKDNTSHLLDFQDNMVVAMAEVVLDMVLAVLELVVPGMACKDMVAKLDRMVGMVHKDCNILSYLSFRMAVVQGEVGNMGEVGCNQSLVLNQKNSHRRRYMKQIALVL